MALTSVFYDGPATESDRAANRAGAADYGVYGANDFKVTAHPSIPYAVLVKAGRAHGHGVTDMAEIDQVVNCPSLASGTRWDLIVVRRNWQPELGGPSVLVVLNAGSEAIIPASRKVGPGVEDDQPLFFVKWQGGISAPAEFIDMRVWAGNTGLVATSTKVMGYLGKVGTQIVINGVMWRYAFGTNGVLGWTSDAPDVKSLLLSGGYAGLGAGYSVPLTRKYSDGLVHMDGAIGASGAFVNVDKARPNRFKIGEVDPAHIPVGLQTLAPLATESMGKVFLYVYPVGHAKAGWVEFEATIAAGVIQKKDFSILLTGGFSWAAAA